MIRPLKIAYNQRAQILTLCFFLFFSSIASKAAVLTIDNYDDDFHVARNTSATVYSENALGGNRRIVDSTWATAAAGALETPSGSIEAAIWAHGLANNQSVQITYGYVAPLNLNFYGYTDYGNPADIFVRAFARTDETQAGMTVRLTLYDNLNNSYFIDNAVGYYGNDIAQEISWNVHTFESHGVNISNISKMTFELRGLKTDGDAYFGVLKSGLVPEPGTMGMMGIASIIIYSARKRNMVKVA